MSLVERLAAKWDCGAACGYAGLGGKQALSESDARWWLNALAAAIECQTIHFRVPGGGGAVFDASHDIAHWLREQAGA